MSESRQKMLQHERQQRRRQLKRQSGKENVPLCSKKRKENIEVDESSSIAPIAHAL